MPDLFRLKGESYEKEKYIFSKYTITVQISEAASPCRRSASCFHNAVYSVFRTRRKILIFYPKTRILPLPLPVSIPVVFREAGSFYIPAIPSTILRQFHPLFSMCCTAILPSIHRMISFYGKMAFSPSRPWKISRSR